tara:strand:- start:128 stop:544 length:417 start_codon:yes stop_codon:yes gene_type:complete
MEKKPLLSKPQRLLKNEKWKPYIRFEKETGRWIAKAVRKERSDNKTMEGTMDKISSKIKVLMEREELDIIARIIAYMYHDKKDSYAGITSDLRKEHIYKDLRSIDQWLNIQYQRIEAQDEKNQKLNALDMEIINEQSK